MKTSIKSIATIALALGLFATSAFAGGGRGASIEIQSIFRMELSESVGTGNAYQHTAKVAVNFGHPNR